MVNLLYVSAIFTAATCLARQAAAHPTEHLDSAQKHREAVAFHSANIHLARTMQQCSGSPEHVARQRLVIVRRSEVADRLRQGRRIEKKSIHGKRDETALEKWMGISHDQSDEGFDLGTPEPVLVEGNTTLALHSETIIGPYWVEGEYIRKHISECQTGVPLHIDIEVLDVNTCRPLPDMVIDIWHANATGIYSGVSAVGQGALDTTWGRGAQITNKDGFVEFDTIFPGHYENRATHIHVLATKDAHLFKNRTYDVGIAQHIGQLFFDQYLIDAVESSGAYTENQQPLTTNADDFVAKEAATDEYDFFMDYALLGDVPSDGLMSWITIGINASADHTGEVRPAAHYYEDGGVDVSDQQTLPADPMGAITPEA